MTRGVLVVVSHARYAEARQRLLDSLGDWPRADVVLVLNGEPADGVTREADGSRTVRFASNLYEYSAFFVPQTLGEPDAAYLLLHDTSVAGADFGRRARAAFDRFRRERCDVLWCSSTGQCNLCVFGAAAAARARRLWGSLSALDKRQAIHWEHNLQDPGGMKGQADLRQVFVDDGSYITGVEPAYSSGRARHSLYFPYLDLTKFYFNMEGHQGEHPDAP